MNKYGHFDNNNKEYVITTPKTPYPWINYLGTDKFFSLISNTCGGYCFYKDPLYRRLIRYRYNNIPLDSNGRYFFIKDNNITWSASWMPVKTDLDNYECRHGLGYTKIFAEKNLLKSELTVFVPLQQNCEIHSLSLTNISNAEKEIDLFSYIEFCLWNASDDMQNFQRNLSIGEVEVINSTIYHKTEYRERRNHYAFYSVNSEINGFDTDRDTFIGTYNGLENPITINKGLASNSHAHGWSPIASHHLKISLKPDDRKNFIFILGYEENPENNKWEKKGIINKQNAKKTIETYREEAIIHNELNLLKNHWQNVFSGFTLECNDKILSNMVNTWNPYQCFITFNLGRSASYFESGIGRGIGFRDTNQDLLGCIGQVPENTKQRIKDIASIQFADGSAYHQYQLLDKKGNSNIGSNFNDDPLWLILSVSQYIKETDDWDILKEKVPFADTRDPETTIFDHIKQSFHHTVNNLGPHNLPLIGRADWNDCLNLNCFSTNPDESFQTCTNKNGKTAESLMIAGLFVYAGEEYMRICGYINQKEEQKFADENLGKMRKSVIEQGWDGKWFLRAYDNDGNKIGSKECAEGKIFIESQGFCSMAKIGIEQKYPRLALDSVKEYLDTPYGIKILTPGFSSYYLNLGEVSSYPVGYKENAGVFCHNNTWIMIAEAIIGRGDMAFSYYQKTCPAYQEKNSETRKMEPYVYPQMVASDEADRKGEAKNSWLTGTAAWNYVVITQWILGIRPDYDGLIIDPCIPKDWTEYKIKRRYKKSTYCISIKNPYHVCKGIKSIKIDGEEIQGNVLPVFKDNKEHNVSVIMG